MRIAITREVSPDLAACELTHREREPIDVRRAREEHRAYEAVLGALGCTVRSLPAEPGLPDAVFVEDTAVVLDELAVIARPGAPSRRAETGSIRAVLMEYRPVSDLTAPATLDGGDVLVVGRTVLVGASGRTNAEGIAQLRALLAPFGYRVVAVPVRGCLHLKSAVGLVAEETLLVNRQHVDPAHFGDSRVIDVDPGEPDAACALRIEDTVVLPAAHPRTRDRLVDAGIMVRTVPLDELAKAEAGVTCCSLIVTE